MEDIPARITLGLWNHRFDIVFNFGYTEFYSPTLEADFQLVMERTVLEDIWHKLFSMLRGYAVGIDLAATVDKLTAFVSHCFTFRNCQGPLQLKFIDLNVLIAIAGWNYPVANATSLHFFTTGGLLLRPWQLRYGLGKWFETDLCLSLNLYLQSESIAMMNAAALYSMIWMVHWFPTPGIASLTTRKDPVKFFKWFSNFQLSVLKGAFLPTSALFSEHSCRSADPKKMISMISYHAGHDPLFSAEKLASCIPSWGNPISSNCFSDLTAIEHILNVIYAVVNAPGVPTHLRFESDPMTVAKALTGKETLVGPYSPCKSATGCRYAKEILSLPDVMTPLVQDGLNTTVGKAYTVFSKFAKVENCAWNHTPLQFAILHAWTHPTQFCKLYIDSFMKKKKIQYFQLQELLVLKPLASALLALPLDDPPILAAYNKNRYSLKDMKRFQISMNLMSSSSENVRKKAARTMSVLSRKHKTTKSVLENLVGNILGPGDQPPTQPTESPTMQTADPSSPSTTLPTDLKSNVPYSPSHPTEEGNTVDQLERDDEYSVEMAINKEEMDEYLRWMDAM